MVHVLTEKGRGYEPARRNPDMFHGIGPFDVKTGRPTEQKSPVRDIQMCFLRRFARRQRKRRNWLPSQQPCREEPGLRSFPQRYPDRFFDVGIAEEHAVSFAAGLALGGRGSGCGNLFLLFCSAL